MDGNPTLDSLYQAPLDEFVRLRNAHAKRLADAGDTEAAAEVRALRKPAVSAWVVNQLVHTRVDDVRALISAGEAIEEAQRKALSGEKGGFDVARRDENAAIERLRAAAFEVMPSITSATLERVTNSLLAGARSAEGRAALAGGRLTQDLEHRGFEAFAGFALPEPPAPPNTGSGDPDEGAARRALVEQLEQRRADAFEMLEMALAEAEAAESRAAVAERQASKARQAATAARRHADEAAATVADASRALEELREAP